jgi:hypothetical protein
MANIITARLEMQPRPDWQTLSAFTGQTQAGGDVHLPFIHP